VFDAKGSPDWRKFALVADSCAFGLTPTRDGLPPEILLATLEEIRADVEDRYHRLSAFPVDVAPEGKLTREIARTPKYRMPVRVLVLDEFQEYFDLGKISKEIAALLAYLVKVAPGAGVIVIGSTQRPSGIGGGGEVGQLFTGFRDNFQVRLSLRTSEWRVSEMVLGAGALGEGLDSSKLLPQYKGVAILRGASDASPTVRTHLADGRDAERILTAARQLRERAGTLTGMAAGIEDEATGRDVLADVLAVFGNDNGLHWEVLAARLAARWPDRWADASPESVSADCRALGVPSVDVKQFGRVLKGCRRAAVEAAAAATG
jgi:DNA segregation ATPase FtsK/SpoIIIE, S-DNA-T family